MCLDASQNKSYPTDLPVKGGLVMWMDAADDSTFTYSSGTTVSQWRDKSGFGYHMTPAAPLSTGPSRSSFLNSRKVLTFTTSQSIGSLSFTMETSANTVFVVSRLTGTTNARVLTAYYNNWLLGHWGGLVNPYYAEGWVYYPPNAADTVWRIYMGEWGGPLNDVAAAYSNGTVLNFNTDQASAGPKGLGINYQSGEPSTCEAAEIIVFNRVLSATERKQVHTYLGQKWGILNTDRSIIDLSGNNNHGLLGNGTTTDMPLFDYYNKGALKLDGTNDYIAVSNATILNPSVVTVSLWIKRNSYQSGITNFLRRNDFDSYAMMATYNSDTVWFRIRNSVPDVVDAQTSMPLNTWTNLVGTFDGSTVRIYKDGVLANTASNTSPISYSATNTTMIIGRDDAVSGRYAPVNYGSVLIYNRVLSAAEIAQNYRAQKEKFTNTIVQQGLTGIFDAGNPYSYAGAGTVWYDVSGNNYTGSLTNGPTYSNQTILFDGTNDFIDLTTANVAVSGNGARSIFVWMRTTAGGLIGFVGTGTPANSQAFNLVKYSSGVGVMGYNNDFYPGAGAAGVTLNDGNWHYIGATFDGTNLRTYADGVLDNTSGAITYSTTGQNNFIGKSNHTGNENYFNGNMGLVQFYNRALSGAEVLQNYNATKGRYGR